MKPHPFSPCSLTPAVLILSLLFLLLLASGCTRPTEPVKIGYAGELSGSRLTPSVFLYRGVNLAVEKWNKAGGIDGRMIELISRDDQGVTREAVRVDRELIALDIDALIGHPVSSTSVAVMELVDEAELVTLTPTATSELLLGTDDFFFTMYGGNSARASALADFAVGTLESEKIGVILDSANGEYTENYLSYFSGFLEENAGKAPAITSVIRYSSINSTVGKGFEALAGELLSGNPDTIFILGSSIDTAKILQQLYKLSWSGPVLISEWASNFELIEQGGPLVENSFFADMEGISGNSPKILDFKKIYGERYSEEPTIGALLGFETAEVLFQALLVSGAGGAELKEELLSGLFTTVSGELYFNPTGDIIRETVIKTIRNDEFVLAP